MVVHLHPSGCWDYSTAAVPPAPPPITPIRLDSITQEAKMGRIKEEYPLADDIDHFEPGQYTGKIPFICDIFHNGGFIW
jgi:hypothetical protein